MLQDPSASAQPRPENPVDRSRRLRSDARERLDAAQRSLDAANTSLGMMLNRRVEPDRRHTPADAGQGKASEDGLAQGLFHGFLDTDPEVRWLDPPNEPPSGDT
jgi:hypothetical protein